MLGKLFHPDEALKIGLVDDLAKDKEEAVEKCEKVLVELSKPIPWALHATKMQARWVLNVLWQDLYYISME